MSLVLYNFHDIFLKLARFGWFVNIRANFRLLIGKTHSRAVAASPVSPVSTGPLFPSPVACLASPISAIARWWHVGTCEMAANSAKVLFRVFQQLILLPSERLVSQASSAKGVACEISERSESRNQCCTTQWAERVNIHTLLCGFREASYWPKNSLRSNVITSKFPKLSGGPCPQIPPSCSVLMHTLRTWPPQIWWRRPCIHINTASYQAGQ